ncbi:MAG TPA: hypothetical protein VF377_08855 [Acidimicrobiia bacterium]
MVPVEAFVQKMLSQEGDKYVFGHEVSMSDTDPEAFDCSEIVEWAAYQVGVQPRVPDGSWYQARHCKAHGLIIPVSEALKTRGALLFRFRTADGKVHDPFSSTVRPASAHVAVSLGDGRTIEARGSRYGVGVFSAVGRDWTHAGLVPGIDYSTDEEVDELAILSEAEQKALKEFLNELYEIGSNVSFVRFVIPDYRKWSRGGGVPTEDPVAREKADRALSILSKIKAVIG